MAKHDVTFFKPYPFKVGQKIRIEGTRRSGDWKIADVGEHKITLRCPISNKELTCDWFCFFVDEKQDWPWPMT